MDSAGTLFMPQLLASSREEAGNIIMWKCEEPGCISHGVLHRRDYAGIEAGHAGDVLVLNGWLRVGWSKWLCPIHANGPCLGVY